MTTSTVTASIPSPAAPSAASSKGVYVQYGCGLCAPDGWLNFDASPTLRMQKLPLVGGLAPGPKFPVEARFGDIISGLPLPDASCDAVYCSHTLEHLSFEDCRQAIRNSFRLLKPGGTFRFVLPDLRYLAGRYMKSQSVDGAETFMMSMLLGERSRRRGFMGLLRYWMGNSDHRWMWDFESMEHELKQAGFIEIRRAQFGDSPDLMFAKVEDIGRWEDCLGMDCKRPVK